VTLRQLEIFVTIVDTGSFTKAAEKLHVAQPSISQHIRTLEEELGERLLFRMRNRKMYLTEAGKLVKKHADSVLRQTEVLRMEVSGITREPTGEIHIGIGGHQLTSMVAPTLREFHRQFPKIRVDVANTTSLRTLELLKENRLDLGIVTLLPREKGLHTEVLFVEEMVVVVRRDDALAAKRFVSPSEIAKLPLVLYDKTTASRRMLDEFFCKENIEPNIVLELSSVEAMEIMVEAGFGASIIPASAANVAPYRDKLRSLRIRNRPLTREVGVATGQFSRLPRVAEALVRLLHLNFRQIGPASL
jgi:LysR family nitrogen assimilation transcriptional regulator